MVRWVNAQNFGSDIAGAIRDAGALLYSDTLTPALRREQLTAAQNQNEGLSAFQNNVRDWSRVAPPNGANTSAPQIRGREQFLSTIAPDAVRVGQQIGVDPRIIVAQSALETGWGRSAPGNNFFGIKSHGRAGGNVLPTTEVIDGRPVQIRDSFRAYGDPSESVADYGQFLTTNPRYAPMLSAPDFDSQIAALGASGYATDPQYASKVRQIAESIDLSPWTGMPPAAPSPFTGAPSAAPGTYNPASNQMFGEMLANGVAAGLSPDEVMAAILGMSANTFGAENQATVNAFVGAGGDYARTYSGFAADQNRQMQETMFTEANETVDVLRDGVPLRIRKGEMLPGDQAILSNTEVQGLTAQGMMDRLTPEQQLAYIGAEPRNPPQADSYVTPDGQVVPSIDGLTDARTGAPLPNGSMRTTVTAQSREASGVDLQGPVVTGLQNQIIGLENFQGQIQAAREVAMQDPTLFGITGALRTGAQNLNEQFRQLQATAPGTAQALETETQSMLDMAMGTADPEGVMTRFFAEQYDPNLSALDLYGRLLPYAAAAALAQQEGRGLSNQDVERFAAVIGDPTSLWSTQRGFLTRLDLLDREVNRLAARSRTMLQQGVSMDVDTPTAQPGVERIGGVSDTANQQAPTTAPAPALPAPQEIARMSMDDLTNLLMMDVSDVPVEALEPFLDAIEQRQRELGR